MAFLVADGFEQLEVTRPMRALRKAGADVRIISLRPGRLRGMNFIWPGLKVAVDDTVEKARAEDYGALYLPGGFVNPDLLRRNQHALEFVRDMNRLGRPIATICHGPEVLISAGLLAGRRIASWPGIADDVRNAGATWVDEPVVHDGHLLSSRGPQDLRAFSDALVEHFDRLAMPQETRLRRRVRWVSWLPRIAAWGTATALAYKSSAISRRVRLARRRGTVGTAADVLRDLGLAVAFGHMLFGKTVLDPSVRVLENRHDRGRMVLAAWRRGALPSGIASLIGTIGWLAGRRRVRGPRALKIATDVSLAAALVSGLVNTWTLAVLDRRSQPNGVALDTGRSAAPEEDQRTRQMVTTGDVSGIVHVGTLASAIGLVSALRP